MAKKWTAWVVKHRVLILIVCGVITLASLAGVPRLRFYNKMSDWLPKDDPKLALYHETTTTFSANNIVLVIARPKDGVFTTETLGKIRDLTDNLKDRPEIFSVTSLSNVADIKKTEDGIEVRDFLDSIPVDPEGLKALEALAHSKDRYIGQVLSENGEWFALSVFVNDKVETILAVEKVIIPEAEKTLGDAMELYFAGVPSDGHFINLYTRRDLVFLVPIMLAAIVLILFFTLRSGKALVPPILVVVLANVWLFGLIGWLKRPMTIITPAIPVLLLALGSAYGLYIVNKIRSDIDVGGVHDAAERKTLVIASTAAVVTPILYAAVTDIVGFLSFRGVNLGLIRDFGLFSAMGLFFAFVLATTVLPALSAAIDFGAAPHSKSHHQLTRVLEAASARVVRKPGRTLAVFAVLMVIGGFGITRVFREVGFSGFYAKNSMPHKAMDTANVHFKGAYPESFFFEAEDVRDPARLRLIRRAESYLSGIKDVNQPLGIPDLIEELNDQMNDRTALPETKAAVENLWLFLEGRKELTQMITPDGRQTIVFAKIADPTTRFCEDVYNRAEDYFKNETALRPVKVDLKSLSPESAAAVRAEEAGFLAQELSWAAGEGGARAPDPVKIKEALVSALAKPLPAGRLGPAVAEKIREFCFAPSFPFDATPGELGAIAGKLSDLAAASPDYGIPEADAVAIFKKVLKPDAFDADVAADAAASAAYLAREARENMRETLLRGELAPLIPKGSATFEKRASAILFDLVDNLAVVPAAAAPPGSEPVAFIRADQTGYPVMTTKLADSLYRSQLQSILLAMAITLFLMIIMRKSVVLGLISVLPITFATVVMYGLLGFLRIPLDYATMLTGSISIGVGVDYTIHFLYVVTEEVRAGHEMREAIRLAFLERGRAMFSNTAAVTAGFSSLLLSSFVLLRSFGGIMVLSMLLCFVGAMTLLPAALLVFRPRILKVKKEN
ncbi:MAG: MMPL family transporter [Candidatus Aminicenantes bacterium]|nr:MMPL family transporter [Candidatus Aminicenantes bacterium]